VNFRPKDQIVLLAGLADDGVRAQIWAFPELQASVERLRGAGLIHDDRLSAPAGEDAAHGLHRIRLDDLVAEHLPERV
jgi:hypothetical protein